MNPFVLLLAQDASWVAVGGNMLPHLVLPLYVSACIAIIVGVAYAIWRFIKRRRGEVRVVGPSTLRKVWKRFISQIPGEFRRSVLFFQPFVVFGEAGSGKSHLIGRYTDWKGQAAQFYPSYSVDPNLQIYLGSRALVQEIPATLLADTAPRARVALVNLWKPLFSKREPIVVATLNAAALKTATPDALRAQAQTLRGKLNVLSRIADKPIPTRVVLTHMDQVEGYTAFAEFVEKQEIPHQLTLDDKAPDGGLQSCLDPVEQYLSLALTSLPAKDYIKILTFLNKAPATFKHLAIFFKTLKEKDPLSYEPEVKELYLTSDTSGSPSALSNPFASSWLLNNLALERARLRKHTLISRVIVGAAAVVLVGAFFFERARIADARGAVEQVKRTPSALIVREAAVKLEEFAQGSDAPLAVNVLPRFRPTATSDLRARFADLLRENWLQARLVPPKDGSVKNPHEYVLYAVALLRSTRDNGIGDYILPRERRGVEEEPADKSVQIDARPAHALEWASVLNLPPPIVDAYVRQNEVAWTDDKLEETFKQAYTSPGRQPDPTLPSVWITLLKSVGEAIENRAINDTTLGDLKRRALALKEKVKEVQKGSTGLDAYKILASDPRFPRAVFAPYIAEAQAPLWFLLSGTAMERITDTILDSRLEIPELAHESIAELIYNLNEIQARSVALGSEIRLEFKAEAGQKDGGSVSFDLRKWLQLLNNSRARALVQRFYERNLNAGAKIFFASGGLYPPVVLRPATSSDYLFPGKYSVPGEMTREAWDREVLPQLISLGRIAPSLKRILDDSTFDSLTRLVEAAVRTYASEYSAHWRNYFGSWAIHADSLVSLRIILGELRLPGSRFQEFLSTVRDNTRFDDVAPVSSDAITNARANELRSKLRDFAAINQLADTAQGKTSELEKFRAIMGRMASDVEGEKAVGPPDPGEQAPAAQLRKAPVEFEQLLTPIGRLSYKILTGSRDSYAREIDKWLDDAKIVEPWSRPFRQSVEQLHVLGRVDIQAAVAKGWERRVVALAVPIAQKFPFAMESRVDATLRDLDETLHPTTGLFWLSFKNYVAPVCVNDQGTWRPMNGLEKNFEWPKALFDITNQLQRVTSTFWDKDANPKALSFRIRPEPLPLGKAEKPMVVLSFLNSGKSSVFGFNQRAMYQTLNVEWWNRPASQVGLQVGDPGDGKKSFKTITEPESDWAFLRLLLRDRLHGLNTWSFNMTQGEAEYPPVVLRFTFQEDPWALFSVPALAQKEAETHESK